MEEIEKDDRLKNFLTGLGFAIFIIYAIYSQFFKTSNEIGFIGADKAGRQILVQTLDAYLEPDIKVDSDFLDYSFLSRVVIQEPMRTTIRFDVQNEQDKASLSTVENFLSQPNDEFITMFKEEISIRDNSEITPDELRKRLNEKNSSTMEGFLAGFGFKKFQIYREGKHVLTVEIDGTKNVYWTGN